MRHLSATSSILAHLCRSAVLFYALVLCTGAGAQGPSAAAQLEGAWRAAGVVIEFSADGRYTATIAGKPKPVKGYWQIVDGKHLLTWIDASRPKRINEFVIRGDYLMVAQSGGQTVVHQRIGVSPSNTPK